jgi:hypothetical protein
MPTDAVTRALLTLILACLLILVVQGFTRCGQGRYQVVALGSEAPPLVRIDSETGALWKLESRDDGSRWIPIAGPDEARGAARAPSPRSATAGSGASPSSPSQPAPPATSAAPGAPRGPAPPPTEEDVELFLEALADPELPPDVRAWTASQLAGIGGTEVTEALLTALGDASAEVVAAAAAALAQRRDPRIESALEELRSHPDPAVQRAARAPRTQPLD